MPFLVWTPDFSVGHPLMDDQHRLLVATIEDLHHHHTQNSGREFLAVLLERLGDYAQEHFEQEEALLQEVGYPDLSHHQGQHERFAAQVADFHQRFLAGQASVSSDLLEFLKNWLRGHILAQDMAYARFLQQNVPQECSR
jgi:hemerythrin